MSQFRDGGCAKESFRVCLERPICPFVDRTDPAAIATALSAALLQHPDALVATIDDGGLFVDAPTTLPLDGHRRSRAGSALDLVQPPDRGAVIDAWERVRAAGVAHTTVRLAGARAATAALQFFDVRSEHGVFVGVVYAVDAVDADLDQAAEIEPPAPRLVRTRKNEIALIIDADDDLTRMLGWTRDEFVGRRSIEFIHPDDHDNAIDTWMQVLSKPGGTFRARLRHLHKDGRWIWLEIANRNVLDTDGYVDCEMFDISEEMDAQEAVRASEQLLRRLAGALPVGVVQFDTERRIVYANERLVEILGASPDADEATMMSTVVDSELLESAIVAVLAGHDADLDVRVDRLDGSGRRLCTVSFRALLGPDGAVTGGVGCLTDITDASQLRAELEARATYDLLTNCVNRATAMATLDQVLCGPSARRLAVIFADLDAFKSVNDEYGHAIGDTLLVAVAARLRDAVRAGDVVGRIGGDEFLMICTDVADATGALVLGERIASAVSEPLVIDGRTLYPRASVGVAHVGTRDVDAEQLIAEADAAMYTSKAAGGGQSTLAGVPAQGHLRPTTSVGELGPQLRQAIARGDLEIHYQPIVDVPRRQTIGYEALLRWRRDGNLVPAGDFIFAAEATGLICDVSPWVVATVCQQAVALRRPELKWFLNLSARELAAPRTIAAFGNALDRFGNEPSSIVVEVTEHAALVEGGVASGVIAELDRMGIGIALDDFGTGHSSLATLHELSVGWIKIDRRFTSSVGTKRGRALVAGVADVAARVGAAAVAEGVETPTELEALQELRIGYAQGYLFGAPAPLEMSVDEAQMV